MKDRNIYRKMTSIILATIMIAGGVTFAVPGTMPAASAQSSNANLFVSAENSAYDNTIAGPMVVEVVVRDSDLSDQDEVESEPRVEIDGDQLRMAQGSDGSWYGYFAQKETAEKADAMAGDNAKMSLNYGTPCPANATTVLDPNDAQGFTDTVGFFVADDACGSNANPTKHQNVIRVTKSLNENSASNPNDTLGQIKLQDEDDWPIIQLYDFSDGDDVVVEYRRGGDPQSVTLSYSDDVADYASLALDRSAYTQGAHVNFVMTDLQMNIDPTDEDTWTFDTNSTADDELYYWMFNEADGTYESAIPIDRTVLDFDDNGYLKINTGTDISQPVLKFEDNGNQNDREDHIGTETLITVVETGPNTGVFENFDGGDMSNLRVANDAKRGTTAVIDYNDAESSIVVVNAFGGITIDKDGVGGVWNSGEEIAVTLTDPDFNKNSLEDEDMVLNEPSTMFIPSVRIGSPITLAGVDTVTFNNSTAGITTSFADDFSDVMRITVNDTKGTSSESITDVVFKSVVEGDKLAKFLRNDISSFKPAAFQFLNYDVRSLGTPVEVGFMYDNGTVGSRVFLDDRDGAQAVKDITDIYADQFKDEDTVDFYVKIKGIIEADTHPVAIDLFNFGQKGDGVTPNDRLNNAIYRLELEESDDNTGVFEGTMEFVMLNQINVRDPATYDAIVPISDEIVLIVHNDLTDEDSVRINYLDLGSDGVKTQIADQVEAPTTSGIVTFDSNNYKVADTVTVTLQDADLNTAVDTIDVFTVVNHVCESDRTDTYYEYVCKGKAGTADYAYDQVGAKEYGKNSEGENFGRILDITFDDQLWLHGCTNPDPRVTKDGNIINPRDNIDNGLGSTGFTLVETAADSGEFVGSFQVPPVYCHRSTSSLDSVESTTGVDMEVNYVDYRDSSGEIIESGDSAGIRANTGTVSLDRTVYPVPFGVPEDFGTNLDGASIFRIHSTGLRGSSASDPGNHLDADLMVHVRINDPDFDVSASGQDSIAQNVPRVDQTADQATHGPLKISISRGASEVVLATAGGEAANDGVITSLGSFRVYNEVTKRLDLMVINDIQVSGTNPTRELGPIIEIAPDAGIFELDLPVRYTDGPAGTQCPATSVFENLDGSTITENGRLVDATGPNSRFSDNDNTHCILQGDIITVEYADPTDASGAPNTVTDSATFDLRNGVLQSDKSVYIIGSDMILTLIEPDLDLESDEAETYSLDLIEWDSDAAAISMGNRGGGADFDPEPSNLRETGDNTGIFQVVVEIPEALAGNTVERGEEIVLEYTDWGPSGADYVGDEDEDVNLTIFTSNFGATIELDQKVYTWTDKIYVTIVAPDHNFDSQLVDEIGDTDVDPIRISTRSADIDNYRLVETGTDTGIFAGEVILTGFSHDADDDSTTGNEFGMDVVSTPSSGVGPTDGKLPTSDDDGITVSFEFSEDATVVATALVRWNIAEVQWLETSYPASGTGTVRVIDPDMNLDPESVDNFDVDVYSDSDSGGIDLTVTETNEATGVFEGTVYFTVDSDSSGHRLRVAEGDSVTADYTDGTLPDPYSTNDDIAITDTAIIGTIVPPLERAPVSNARVVDSFGNALTSVSVDQQVQITADLVNGQDRTQEFAYLVQIQDSNGVTVSLAWITGQLNTGQSLAPAQSWTPEAAGSYTATVFVWESLDNPTALSPPDTVTINVR